MSPEQIRFVEVMARAYYEASEIGESTAWDDLPAIIREDKTQRMVPALDALLDRFRLEATR